jgi:hypothetical protein
VLTILIDELADAMGHCGRPNRDSIGSDLVTLAAAALMILLSTTATPTPASVPVDYAERRGWCPIWSSTPERTDNLSRPAGTIEPINLFVPVPRRCSPIEQGEN